MKKVIKYIYIVYKWIDRQNNQKQFVNCYKVKNRALRNSNNLNSSRHNTGVYFVERQMLN